MKDRSPELLIPSGHQLFEAPDPMAVLTAEGIIVDAKGADDTQPSSNLEPLNGREPNADQRSREEFRQAPSLPREMRSHTRDVLATETRTLGRAGVPECTTGHAVLRLLSDAIRRILVRLWEGGEASAQKLAY